MSLYYHKIDSYKWLTGSIRRDLEPDERSVWADLLALGALTREPRRGYIERSKGIPYDENYLLMFLNINSELLDRTIAKCVKEGRLKVYKDGTMLLTNWNSYNDVEEWRKKKTKEKTLKEKKRISIENARKTKHTLDNIAVSTTQTLNKLNGIVNQLDEKVNEIAANKNSEVM